MHCPLCAGEAIVAFHRDRRGPYLLVAADGTETAVPAAAPASWLVTLIAREGRWLVAEASPEVTTPREQP